MSAFMVTKEHIDTLVRAAMSHRYGTGWYHNGMSNRLYQLDYPGADRIGQVLWAENAKSVAYRYQDDTENEIQEDPYTFPRTYAAAQRASVVQVLKAIDCYEYQACEHPGWKDSEAKAFCSGLRKAMIGELPGYEEAQWCIAPAGVAR